MAVEKVAGHVAGDDFAVGSHECEIFFASVGSDFIADVNQLAQARIELPAVWLMNPSDSSGLLPQPR